MSAGIERIRSVSSISPTPAANNWTFASDAGLVFGEMMRLTLRDDLAFTRLTISYHGRTIDIDHVLIDTGSASTILAARELAALGIAPEMDDVVFTVRGVGGSEAVFTRHVDQMAVETKALANFEIEVGSMDYGFDLNGILGMDFLIQAGAVINLRDLTLEFETR